MDYGLQGRVALVTGAASGIGRATAGLFAVMGARVVASDVDADRGAATVRELGPPAVRRSSSAQTSPTALRSRRSWLSRLRATGGWIAPPTAPALAAAMRSRTSIPTTAAIDTPMMDETFERFPGFRETMLAFVPMGRMGRPEEVAATIAWLSSDAASFITGEGLAVEGGLLAR